MVGHFPNIEDINCQPHDALHITPSTSIESADSALTHAVMKYEQMMELEVLRALMFLQVFDAIPSDCQPITLKDLSKKTGAEPSLLFRLLAIAATSGLVVQHDNGDYTHTAISLGYRTGEIATNLFTVMHDEAMMTASLFPAWLKHKGRLEDPSGQSCNTHNPWLWRAGHEGERLFDVFPQYPERHRIFQESLAALGRFRPFTGFYDYSKLLSLANTSERPIIVDIGGGCGHFITNVLKAHPELQPHHMYIQDVPQVIEMARQNPDLPKEVNLLQHDFFDVQTVQGARAYHIRSCLHDYSDELVIQILERIVPAMACDSKVLIAEDVLSDIPQRGDMARYMDMCIMMFGGKERTQANWRSVCDKAGLKVDAIHFASGKAWAIIEATLKRNSNDYIHVSVEDSM